jgi:hypothetical protein
MQDLFEKSSRGKLRFDTEKGKISDEELWDLALDSLDTLAKSVNKELKESTEESFIAKKSTTNTTLELKLEIIKYVISVRLAEKAEAKVRAEKQNRLKFLKDLLERKEIQQLEGSSADDIRKQIEELESESVN